MLQRRRRDQRVAGADRFAQARERDAQRCDPPGFGAAEAPANHGAAPTERFPPPDPFQTAKSPPSPSDQAFSIASPRRNSYPCTVLISRVPVVVLTGGPGGGKSTLMRELRAQDPSARRWLLIPESAPLLFQAGLDARAKSFQRAVVRLQMALEELCTKAARPGQALVCHRGTLDPLAYWLRNSWNEEEFFVHTEMSRAEHCRRYLGVLHLQTAAIGAEMHYRRWPDTHRPETLAQAAEIDRLCARAWNGHPCYVLIDNANQDWPAKARAAHALLTRWLASASE